MKEEKSRHDVQEGEGRRGEVYLFSAFCLRSSVYLFLISLTSDTRFIEPHDHDINVLFVGFGFNLQLAARTCKGRLGIALSPW